MKKILKISTIIISTTLLFAAMSFAAIPALSAPNGPKLLDPTSIPKYVNQITGAPPVYTPTVINGVETYTVEMTKSNQQILPPGS